MYNMMFKKLMAKVQTLKEHSDASLFLKDFAMDTETIICLKVKQ